MWLVAFCRNAIHGQVYNWANRLKEVQVAQLRSSGADIQTRVCLIARVVPLPPLLDTLEIFALFCHPVIIWSTHWGWKGFYHQPPTPNPPSSLWLRGHYIFLLRESPLMSGPSHTTHDTGRARVIRFNDFGASQVQNRNIARYPPTGIWQHNQSCFLCSSVTCTRHSLGHHSAQTPWQHFTRAFLVSWRWDWGLGEEMGRVSLPLLCVPVALALIGTLPLSLCLSFPWSVKQ